MSVTRVVLLVFLVSAAWASEFQNVHDNLVGYDLRQVPQDHSWMTGRSRLIGIEEPGVFAKKKGTNDSAPETDPTATDDPSAETEKPTEKPTKATKAPTQAPTKEPTQAPTEAPTQAPTKAPTQAPTKAPTQAPTKAPTQPPTKAPTQAPTKAPTQPPTKAPTQPPTKAPTQAPTKAPTQPPTKPPTPKPAAKCTSKFSCSDCNTAQICQPNGNGGFNLLSSITCPTDAPYCDYSTGTCTTIPDATCGTTASQFHCLRDGHFPDQSISNAYYVCENYVAHKFECTIPGETYDASTEQCIKNDKFVTFACDQSGKKTPYAKTAQYFGYCDEKTAQPFVVDRCPGAYELNVTSQECEPACHADGIVPDADDCTKYYKCETIWLDGGNKAIVKEMKTCPPNTSFSTTENMCVAGLTNPDCPVKTTI